MLLTVAWATSNGTPTHAESVVVRTTFASEGFSVTINGDSHDSKLRVCALTNTDVRSLQGPPKGPLVSLITEDWAGPRFVVFDPLVTFKQSKAIVLVDATTWKLTGLTDGGLFAVPINFDEEGYYIIDALKHGKQLKIDSGTNGRTYTVRLQGFNAALKALTDCNGYLIDHPHG